MHRAMRGVKFVYLSQYNHQFRPIRSQLIETVIEAKWMVKVKVLNLKISYIDISIKQMMSKAGFAVCRWSIS